MPYRWIGAMLIIGSCSGFGLSLAVHHIREIQLLNALNTILDRMICELRYKLTPLPDLIRNNAVQAPKTLSQVFLQFADNLDRQILPDVSCCMEVSLNAASLPFDNLNDILNMLGQSLGRFDLNGQIVGITGVKEQCTQKLNALKSDHRDQIRSYRLLGLCAGIALAIFLF